ncbi:MAG: N-acetylglucosamine-6-phosphate deacetylase [Oscillospiraceae bacterium]|nr:N-acetylglucosamine-6-phosphate deacetylase [Oscillospiraceae bacterium]
MHIEDVQILMGDGVFRKGSVEFGETIEKIEISEASGIDFGVGQYLIPGLVDVHTHGAIGGDHNDGSGEKMAEMAQFYARNGVTSFLATTLTAAEPVLEKAMRNVARFERPPDGARCLGVNLEGPFFSHGKRGAHPADLLRLPDISLFERLFRLSGESIKLVCVSPELDGAMDFIREASKLAHVSLAHSNADYKTAMQAFANGATHVTHLFNGMSPFLHREPGIVGAALDANAFVEVICDGYHLHPAVVRAIFGMFPKRACLISDSLRCTGLPDGDYESAGLPIIVRAGRAMLADGSSLAGSAITLLQGVRIAVSLGVPLANAVSSASSHCAQALGMEGMIGSLVPGAYADFVLLDSKLDVQKVYINGKEAPSTSGKC